jgi:hypothetical protein
MIATTPKNSLRRPHTILYTTLPGPTRKRKPVPYSYRLVYQSPEPTARGCALLWEVYGGRTMYQVALERQSDGGLVWHCTCADHVYRTDAQAHHVCKHIRGLAGIGRRPLPA